MKKYYDRNLYESFERAGYPVAQLEVPLDFTEFGPHSLVVQQIGAVGVTGVVLRDSWVLVRLHLGISCQLPRFVVAEFGISIPGCDSLKFEILDEESCGYEYSNDELLGNHKTKNMRKGDYIEGILLARALRSSPADITDPVNVDVEIGNPLMTCHGSFPFRIERQESKRETKSASDRKPSTKRPPLLERLIINKEYGEAPASNTDARHTFRVPPPAQNPKARESEQLDHSRLFKKMMEDYQHRNGHEWPTSREFK